MRTLLGVCAGAMLTTACSDVGFRTSKQETLSKSSVFGDASGELHQNDGSTGGLRSFPGRDSSDGAINSYGLDATAGDLTQPAYLGYPGQLSQPIERMCSQRRSEDFTNFKRAKNLGQKMELKVNGATCTTNAAAIESLILKSSVSINDLKALCPAAVPSKGRVEPITIFNGSNYAAKYGFAQRLSVLYANRNEEPDEDRGDVAAEMGDENCTAQASPLVVHLPATTMSVSYVELTSVEAGANFDLLGANNGHEAVRIGWFTNTDFALLTLPDLQGEVNGIDELFGDNTEGPDGRFAANGYAALAKYDGASADGFFRLEDADGRIDLRDPVFHHLRLWKDENLDAIAQPNELISLQDVGIAFIDLEFSDAYEETDQYGNKTMMKSVIGYDNGALDLIFDLWFRYENF